MIPQARVCKSVLCFFFFFFFVFFFFFFFFGECSQPCADEMQRSYQERKLALAKFLRQRVAAKNLKIPLGHAGQKAIYEVKGALMAKEYGSTFNNLPAQSTFYNLMSSLSFWPRLSFPCLGLWNLTLLLSQHTFVTHDL